MKIENTKLGEQEENDNINDTIKDKNILSITFFLVVVLITLGLLSYNYFIDKNIISINKDINKIDTSIAEINQDKNIGVYKLISSNRIALVDLKNKSNITGFINHLNDIKKLYNLDLKGFDYQNGNLKTSVIITNNPDSLSYKKAENFISKYRKEKNSIFNLGFISSVTGNDKINFNISLELKK